MTNIKKPIINYTARDFQSIKAELVNFAQKYYPDTFKDFNEASFGSLMLDLVSYVGDVTSFYTDYQANEAYLDTSLELSNILKISKHMGYKHRPNASSFGEISFFISVPSNAFEATPDYSYAPMLKKGSTFSGAGGSLFTLVEDVDFANTIDSVVVASTNAQGTAPTRFALKAKGVVVSGELFSQAFVIDDYKKFLQLRILDDNLTEIVSVQDSNGNNYYEVDYLSQDIIYVPVLAAKVDKKYAKNILKPISVPRRFVVEHNLGSTTLQFGYGTEDNEEKVLDPATVMLDVFGKNYINDKSFDPTVLTKTTNLGIVPSSTVLNVVYRRNNSTTVNAPPSTVSTAVSPLFKFFDVDELSTTEVSDVVNSLELINETAITGKRVNTSIQEMKLRAQGAYGAQNRAVTKDDYISLCYNMPSNFGQIKKAALTRDQTSFNGKNLNLYVISTDLFGDLIPTEHVIKQNLKTWINKYKMIGDTIDILNAKIINLQINFSVVGYANVSKYDVIDSCLETLSSYYSNLDMEIGEPFKISDVYKLLNSIPSVVDTKHVEVTQKYGINYSSYNVPYEQLISSDGRYLIPPDDTVFEVKFPNKDITGGTI